MAATGYGAAAEQRAAAVRCRSPRGSGRSSGRQLGRALTAAELHIDVAAIDRALERAKDQLEQAIDREQRRAVRRMLRGLRLRLDVTGEMLAVLEALHREGRRQALREMRSTGAQPPHRFAVDPVEPRLGPSVQRLRDGLGRLTVRMEREAVAADVGGLAGEAVRRRLMRVAGARDAASRVVSGAFASGLAATFEDADALGLFDGWQYTAVLDAGTCVECRAKDGRTYRTLAEAYADLPDFGPNPRCLGDGRCRCRLVPTRAAGPGQNPPVPSGGGAGGAGGGKPPAPPGGPLEPPGDEERIIAQLDRDFSVWAAGLTTAEREAIRIYQATDLRYRLINDVRRGRRPVDSLSHAEAAMVARVSESLDAAIAKGKIRFPLRVWRGARRAELQLGVPLDRVDEVLGAELALRGYFATTIRRQVAVDEFTSRTRSAESVLLDVSVPAEASAAWVALAGDPRLRRQAELLFPDPTRILITGVRREGVHTIVSCELIS
ncbi:MAG: hypothetical protein IT201_08685 [Thermoleophilia bacterium]|nr:hypothetical protein [Thermoleophilia bacterium]